MDKEFWVRFDQFAAKMAESAPMAYDKLVMLMQAKSIAYLCVGFGLLLLSAFFRKGAAICIKKTIDEELYVIGAIICGFLTFLTLSAGIINVFNIWNWIGAFQPEARLLNETWNAIQQRV